MSVEGAGNYRKGGCGSPKGSDISLCRQKVQGLEFLKKKKKKS
jgi:hypothetical protein